MQYRTECRNHRRKIIFIASVGSLKLLEAPRMQNSSACSSQLWPTCRKLRFPEGFGSWGGGRTSKGAESKRSLAYSLVRSGKDCRGLVWKETAFRLAVHSKAGVLRVVGTGRGRSGCRGLTLKLPGPRRGACRESTGRLSPARGQPRVGPEMQSTDLGNKESGKIWHRKPSPASRDG